MKALTQLQEIEHVALSNPHSVYYYLKGWRGCCICGLLFNWDGKYCPHCGRTLRTKPSSKKGRRHFFELVNNAVKKLTYIQKIEKMKSEKQCSMCGSRDCRNYNIRINRRYPIWVHDGNGGYLCQPCYRRSK